MSGIEIIELATGVELIEVPFVVEVSTGPTPAAPANLVPPAWGDGVAQVGQAYPFDAGVYSGTEPITFVRNVEGLAGGNWVALESDIGDSPYTLPIIAPFTEGIRVAETASNAEGLASTVYSDTLVVYSSGAFATATTLPEIAVGDGSGSGLDEGDTLQGVSGTYDGSGAPVTAIESRWTRDGTPIVGATSSSYVVTADDLGAVLAFEQRVDTSVSTGTIWYSSALVQVPGPAPAIVTDPSWSGIFQDQQAATLVDGAYSEAVTLSNAFEGKRISDGAWEPVTDVAVSGEIVAQTVTFGAFASIAYDAFRVAQTATTSDGQTVTAYTSEQVVYANGALPTNVTAPTTILTGTAGVGGVLSMTGDAWDGSGRTITGFEYQWLRDGAPIAGETSATYALTADDQGTTLTPQRRALSAAGASIWASADAVSVPAAVSGGPANDGTIYPADLTLYATDDPDSILVGSPTFHGDGSVELTIAAGAAQTRDRGATFFFELATDSQGRTWPVDIDAGPPVGACVAGIETVAGSGNLSADIPDATVPDGTYVRVGTGLAWATGAAPTSLLTSNSWVAWGVRTESGGVSSLVRSLYMSDSTEQTSPSDALPSAAGAYGALGARPTNSRRAVLQRGGAGTFRPNGDSLDVDTFNSNVFPAAFAQCFITVGRCEALTGNRTIRVKPFLHLVLLDPPGDPV